MRTALSIGVLLIGLCAGPADGAGSCSIVTDPAGDERVVHAPVAVGAATPEVDLRFIDVTSDARSLTVVIAVQDLAARSVATSLGARWEVNFSPSGSGEMLALWADRTADGALRFSAGHGPPYFPDRVTLGQVEGSADLERNRLRITAPLDVFAPVATLRRGTRLEGVQALSRRFIVPNGPIGTDADYTGAAEHQIGDRSCRR